MSESDITPRDDGPDDERDDEQALRDPLLEGARRGVRVHGTITGVISVLLIAQRSLSVVFQASEALSDFSISGWDRFRDWILPISGWLALR